MPEITPSRYMVQAGWTDVPHLSADVQRELMASVLPHQREARSKGIPSMGSGAIYPIPFEEVSRKPFEIPAYWPRAFGLDVGWKRTAAIWGAHDRSSDVVYCYSEHYGGQATPAIHASAIKARGAWIPGIIDPASRSAGQMDGAELLEAYKAQGLRLTLADNSVDAGLYEVWSRLETGRLKFFTTLGNTAAEYRLYRRDERGRIIKEFDHLMDAVRYLILSIVKVAIVMPVPGGRGTAYRAADKTAGY